MIVAAVEDVTDLVATENVALELPAFTLTLAANVAEALLLTKPIEMPPDGAGALKVTVPVEELPPVTAAGLSETEASAMATGLIVSTADLKPL